MTKDYNEFRAHWRVIVAAAIGVGAGVTGAMVYSLSILITPLTDTFGWTRAEVSGAKTFLTLGFVVTAPFVGYIADRFGVRKIAMVSLFGLAVAMFGMTQMNGNIIVFYASIFALSLAGSCTTPLVWTRGVATWFEEKRGLALGLTLTGTGVAGFMVPVFVGGLVDRYDWRAGYLVMGVAALLAIIPVYFLFFENGRVNKKTVAEAAKPETRTSSALQSGFTVPEALKTIRFWQLAFAFTLIGGMISSLMVHLVPLLTDSGMSRSLAVRIAGLMGVAVILGRVTTGFLVDRFHPPYVAAFFLAMPVIGCLLLSGGTPALGLVMAAAIFIGLAAGSEVDLVPYLTARYFGLKAYGKLYGAVFIFFYAGVGIVPPAFGYVFDLYGNYDLALDFAVAALGIGVLAVATLGRAPDFTVVDPSSAPVSEAAK
ncbi:MAG: MFS transporter [Rhodospirillaceae bacterium]|jgi:MFS family permease|nr:MFS transporter [Rhodospirillaceae bacterium]